MYRLYGNPPLREAVCEFRFTPGSSWDLAIPGLFYAALEYEYPRRLSVQPNFRATLAVGMEGAQQEIQSVQTSDELRFWRDSDDGVIRLRPNILSVSHYKPYPSWQGFRPIIMQVLEAYREVANPAGIQRIGLRYINEFELDDSSGNTALDIDEVFDVGPKVGDQMNQELASFFVGIQYHFGEERDSLRIQMQPVPPEHAGAIKVTLDLDYFLNQPGQVAFDRVGDWLDSAHHRINESFEGCLKEPLRKLLEEGT